MSNLHAETNRLRRRNRVDNERLAVLGDGKGNLYAQEDGMYFAHWYSDMDANGNALVGPIFRLRAGGTNYIPQAGRQVWVAMDRHGRLTITDGDFDDMVNAGLDPRASNPNDAFRQFVYTPNIVTFRSDGVATSADTGLFVNLDQLLYIDTYGAMSLWNGTSDGTHLDMQPHVPGTDLHCFALVYLRTFENLPCVVSSTPKSLFTPLGVEDIQECINSADAESIFSRVYALANDQETLIASPVTDWDVRQWINVPARLGNPNPITRRERVRAGQQLTYQGWLTVTGELEILGEVVVL